MRVTLRWSLRNVRSCIFARFLEVRKQDLKHTHTGTSVKDRDFTTWIEQLKEAEKSREKNNRQSAERASIGHGDLDQQKLLNPLALCYEVDRCLGPEPKGNTHGTDNTPSLMVGDGGDFVACAAYVLYSKQNHM